MTTAASFPSLHAPLQEDSMEMSSPAQQTAYDDDIEIDFDEPVGGVELTDDERMADDIEQPRPATATDEMMEDDAPPQETQAPEQEMQDDFDAVAYEQADPDDELIDYGDDDYQEMTENNEQPAYEPPAPEITLEDQEITDSGISQAPEEAELVKEASVPVEEAVAEESTIENAAEVPDDAIAPETNDVFTVEEGPEAGPEDNTNEEEAALYTSEQQADTTAVPDDDVNQIDTSAAPLEKEPFPELPEDSSELKPTHSVPAPLQTNLEAVADAPGTPTDTGLHSMIMQYGDWEWPLFKSKKQPDGLLKDDNLASVALADLLRSCRDRLALKAGEEISEDQEFVLQFDTTGLTIVENSPSAFNTSLDEILEVFKQLHLNDGAQSIPPLWLHLSLQARPSSYLMMLKQAAAGGQGISSFVDVPAGEIPENYEEYYQDGDEDPTLFGDASGINYDDQAQNDGQDAAGETELTEGDYHEYDTSHENTDGGQDAQESYDQYYQYDEAEQAEYDAYAEGEEVDAVAEHAEYADETQPDEDNNGPSHVNDDPVATQPDSNAEQAATTAPVDSTGECNGEAANVKVDEGGEGLNEDSAASSTTLRPDQANDAVGEYKDEDLIDWDDSTLTSYISDNATDDNDFSTFLTEPDLDDTTTSAAVDVSGATDAQDDHSAELATKDVPTGTQHVGPAIETHEPEPTAEISFNLDDNTYTEDEPADREAQREQPKASTDEPAGVESTPQQEAVTSATIVEQPATSAPVNGDAQHSAEPSVATKSQEPARNEEDYIDFGDEDGIDFDDDTYEQHEARKASEANSSSSRSPSGKRPLDETEGIDFTEQPDMKKVKSS